MTEEHDGYDDQVHRMLSQWEPDISAFSDGEDTFDISVTSCAAITDAEGSVVCLCEPEVAKALAKAIQLGIRALARSFPTLPGEDPYWRSP